MKGGGADKVHRTIYSEYDASNASTSSSSVCFMQFQHQVMFNFCHLHPDSMPADEGRQYELLKHLLYDDEKEVIFCYVPKGEVAPFHIPILHHCGIPCSLFEFSVSIVTYFTNVVSSQCNPGPHCNVT